MNKLCEAVCMSERERENIDRPLQHYEDIYMREPAIGARPGRP